MKKSQAFYGLLFALFFPFFSASLHAQCPGELPGQATFYVTANATGQGDGSCSNPWTLSQATSLANQQLLSGSVVYVKAGDYGNTPTRFRVSNVTYEGYFMSPGNVGTLPPDAKTYRDNVSFYKLLYPTLEGDTRSQGNAFTFSSVSNVTLRNFHVRNFLNGVVIHSGSNNTVDNVLVANMGMPIPARDGNNQYYTTLTTVNNETREKLAFWSNTYEYKNASYKGIGVYTSITPGTEIRNSMVIDVDAEAFTINSGNVKVINCVALNAGDYVVDKYNDPLYAQLETQYGPKGYRLYIDPDLAFNQKPGMDYPFIIRGIAGGTTGSVIEGCRFEKDTWMSQPGNDPRWSGPNKNPSIYLTDHGAVIQAIKPDTGLSFHASGNTIRNFTSQGASNAIELRGLYCKFNTIEDVEVIDQARSAIGMFTGSHHNTFRRIRANKVIWPIYTSYIGPAIDTRKNGVFNCDFRIIDGGAVVGAWQHGRPSDWSFDDITVSNCTFVGYTTNTAVFEGNTGSPADFKFLNCSFYNIGDYDRHSNNPAKRATGTYIAYSNFYGASWNPPFAAVTSDYQTYFVLKNNPQFLGDASNDPQNANVRLSSASSLKDWGHSRQEMLNNYGIPDLADLGGNTGPCAASLPNASNSARYSTGAYEYCTGTSKQELASAPPTEIKVFPNPGSGTFHLQGFGEAPFRVHDQLGRLIGQWEGVSSIDLSAHPAGIYYLRQGAEVIRLVKQ